MGLSGDRQSLLSTGTIPQPLITDLPVYATTYASDRDMGAITNAATSWLLISALYAMIAIGFTMIFGIGNVLNLFHGASITVGAYAAYVVYDLGNPVWIAVVIGLAVPGILNVILYMAAIRYILDKPVTVMVITLILAVVVEEIILVWWGDSPKVVPDLFPGSIELAGVTLQANRVFVFVISWVIIGLLLYFVNYTRTGKAIMATSMSKKGASIVGIENDRMMMYTWLLAGVLAGLAGVFIASFQTASYDMGIDPLILAFTIVVLGGIGSIRGSIVGAYLIGGLETATTSFLDPSLNGLASLVVLVIILLVKPEGLFGRELMEES